MCGRSDQNLTWADIWELSGIIGSSPTSNLRLSTTSSRLQPDHIAREKDSERIIEKARWGLLPRSWKKPAKDWTYSTFNATDLGVSSWLMNRKNMPIASIKDA